MATDFEITGKKKILVDDSGYYNVKRTEVSFNKPDPILGDTDHHGVYYNTSIAVDKVRIVIGKNWDYHIINNKPIFSNDWNENYHVESFAGNPIILDACGPPGTSSYGPNHPIPPHAIDQEILLKIFYRPSTDFDTTQGLQAGFASELQNVGKSWGSYIKTGLDNRLPIIKANHEFFDHYHNTFVPFTPDELIKKQPTGKAYFADYKTYYNERLDSIPFEQAVGLRPELQNSLPSIYGFLRLAKNSLLLEDGNFELTKLLDYIIPYRNYNESWTRSDVYKNLFQKYPLETSTFLYAMINNHRTDQLSGEMSWLPEDDAYNNQMVERIINLDYTKFDASALFEEYFDTYASLIDGYKKRLDYNNGKLNKVKALERIMSNVIFSPNFIPIMDKVDQYKKYFPYYVDLQFTAKRLTVIGDLMKDLFMTRYLSYKVVASKMVKGLSDWAQYTYGITSPWCPSPKGLDNCDAGRKFVEFADEKIYADLSGKQLDYTEQVLGDPKQKRTFDFQAVIKEFAAATTVIDPHKKARDTDPDGYDNPNDFYRDIRNYVTFVRDDFKDPVKLLDDDNTVFKTLCGAAFQLKIMNLYKMHRRSYLDIMNGIPAYAEDLFYRIEKQRKMKPTESDPNPEWKAIQSILIPNTSDLNIARYVDTQLKYSTFATYRYNVYTMRVVFGSKYKYLWGKSTVDTDTGKKLFRSNNKQTFGATTSTHDKSGVGILFFSEEDEILDGLQGNGIVTELEKAAVEGVPDTYEEVSIVNEYYRPADHLLGSGWKLEATQGPGSTQPAPWRGLSKTYVPSGESQAGYYKIKEIMTLQGHMMKGTIEPEFEVTIIPVAAIEAVAATYKLVLPSQSPPGSGKYLYTAKFLVRVEPSIQVIEDKLFSTPEIFIMDRPPMPPDIDIIPYRAVNNKLKFLLNGTTGRAKEKPIIMLESDKEKFDLVARAQLVPQFDDHGDPLPLQPIEFANDDPVQKFQIFRVKDNKPVLFEDFELYRDAIGSVFEETIFPNTKYYYTFRAIDDHDHISNPSPVYEVELIDEKGAVKPMIRLVSMDPIEPNSFTKECQKYIYIKPSIKQLYFSENEEVDGIFSSELKKKKYKLRLTSKGSGKKIDINFSFEKTIGSL